MLADDIQCSELKLNGIQCQNPAYVIVERDGKDVNYCRLHFSLYLTINKDIETVYRTLKPEMRSDAERLADFICKKEVKS